MPCKRLRSVFNDGTWNFSGRYYNYKDPLSAQLEHCLHLKEAVDDTKLVKKLDNLGDLVDLLSVLTDRRLIDKRDMFQS
ncbi:unnamed protein product, partial [Durusdinium trenchii]